jgi:hypothetical protein
MLGWEVTSLEDLNSKNPKTSRSLSLSPLEAVGEQNMGFRVCFGGIYRPPTASMQILLRLILTQTVTIWMIIEPFRQFLNLKIDVDHSDDQTSFLFFR